MATDIAAPKLTTMADLKGKVDPDWCPGCGDFGVLAAVQKALVELQIPPQSTQPPGAVFLGLRPVPDCDLVWLLDNLELPVARQFSRRRGHSYETAGRSLGNYGGHVCGGDYCEARRSPVE